MTRPIMNDPAQLASLEGQQYLVLRPASAVMAEFMEVQDAARATLPEGVRYPFTGHVTLRGFAAPERLDDLADIVHTWARSQRPVEVVAEALDGFATPWQILILRLARTPSLVAAYASLTSALVTTDLVRLDELDLDDWTFHMSVAYCRALGAEEWAAIDRDFRRVISPAPAEVVHEAEFIRYSGGVEHREIIPLGA